MRRESPKLVTKGRRVRSLENLGILPRTPMDSSVDRETWNRTSPRRDVSRSIELLRKIGASTESDCPYRKSMYVSPSVSVPNPFSKRCCHEAPETTSFWLLPNIRELSDRCS